MIYGSPIVSSTPGGIVIGVRPSLDCCGADAENARRAGVAAALASAGTRNDGSVIIEGERAAARALLGASMVETFCMTRWGRFTSPRGMATTASNELLKIMDAIMSAPATAPTTELASVNRPEPPPPPAAPVNNKQLSSNLLPRSGGISKSPLGGKVQAKTTAILYTSSHIRVSLLSFVPFGFCWSLQKHYTLGSNSRKNVSCLQICRDNKCGPAFCTSRGETAGNHLPPQQASICLAFTSLRSPSRDSKYSIRTIDVLARL